MYMYVINYNIALKTQILVDFYNKRKEKNEDKSFNFFGDTVYDKNMKNMRMLILAPNFLQGSIFILFLAKTTRISL